MEMTGGGNYDKPQRLALRLPAFQGLNPAPMGLEDNKNNVPLGLFLVALPTGCSWKFCWGSRTMEGVFFVFPLVIFAMFFSIRFHPRPEFFLDKIWMLMLLWTESASGE